MKGLLHRVQRSAGGSQALDSRNLVALGLDGEHQAGPNRRAVQQDRAAPAHPVLATDVGAGQAEVVTEMVGEQPPRIGRRRVGDPVDLQAAKTSSVRTRTR
jgi:hypothetical protein